MKIDLGQEIGSIAEPVEPEDEKWYPTLEITSEERYEIPEEGKATIEFKKIRSSEENTKEGTRYSCTLKVKTISSFKKKGKDKKQSNKSEEKLSDEEYIDAELDKEMEGK
jgi:hypothetical protein